MHRHLVFLSFLSLLLVGCATQEPLTQFFVLTPPNSVSSPIARSGRIQVLVRRVEAPAYLARTSLASMSNGNQVQYSPVARWAEPLDLGIARAVADDLNARGIRAMGFQPNVAVALHTYEVGIRILRFEGTAAGQVALSATWQIFPTERDVPNVSRATNVVLNGWTPGDEAGLATLLSQAVTVMAGQIANALR
jgi:uncharacterized lipoprotein YmbA